MSNIRLRFAAALFAVFASASAHAAVNLYLCIQDSGFKGEPGTTDPTYANCSSLSTISHTGFIDGNAPISRDIKVTKRYDSMSAALRKAMVLGTLIHQVKIDAVSAGETPTDFQDIRLVGATVSSAAMTLDGSETFVETIGFTPVKIEYTYRQQSGGSYLAPTLMCWDVANQTAATGPCS